MKIIQKQKNVWYIYHKNNVILTIEKNYDNDFIIRESGNIIANENTLKEAKQICKNIHIKKP